MVKFSKNVGIKVYNKPLPRDPEMAHLSKDDAQEKIRKQKELDAMVKAYEIKTKAEIDGRGEESVSESVSEPVEEVKPEVVVKKTKTKK